MLCPPSSLPAVLMVYYFLQVIKQKQRLAQGCPASYTLSSGSVKCVARREEADSEAVSQSHITRTQATVTRPGILQYQPAGENRFCNGLPPPATTSKATSQSPSSQFSNARREMYLELLHTAAHRRALTDSLVNNYKYHRDLSNRMSSSKKSTR